MDKLIGAGLVVKTEKVIGRKVIFLRLTSEGEMVARQLKKAEAAAKGIKFTFPDKFGIITSLDASEKLTMDEIANTYPDPASTLRELESLKLIKQTIDTSQYPMQNYFSLTEKGKKVAVKLKEIDELINP
ncbi:MAG: winged helix-turn-helix transcriptional regulator [Candidatus Thermoplasmatota archaeon]|nr:winged helix-turn-helix transcriptional regulator [Candidatus Thermoplasmatota archaeon]